MRIQCRLMTTHSLPFTVEESSLSSRCSKASGLAASVLLQVQESEVCLYPCACVLVQMTFAPCRFRMSRIWMSKVKPLLQLIDRANDLWAECRHLTLQKQTGVARGETRLQ